MSAASSFRETVSIVVPVYRGVEQARRVVASIARQRRAVDQLVLVDDCGRDGAFDAALAEAEGHGLRPSVVRRERNGGVSAARNDGLRAATGDFVGFVDADDALAEDFVAELAGLLRSPDVQVAVCGIGLLGPDHRVLGDEPVEDAGFAASLDGEEYARRLLRDEAKGYVCNKLFRRSVLGTDPFAEGRVYEDFPVMVAVALASSRVAFSPRALYYYTQHDAGVSRRFGPHVGDLAAQLDDVRRIVGERAGFERELLIHRVGGVALPMANMAFRARHAPDDSPHRRLAAEMITRARRFITVSDLPVLARSGRRREAVAAATLLASPALYSRVLRHR